LAIEGRNIRAPTSTSRIAMIADENTSSDESQIFLRNI
jgi:hypothetical protein